MKITSKLFASVLLAGSLAACGGGEDDGGGSTLHVNAATTSPSYPAVPPVVGEVATYKETTVTLGGSTSTRNVAYTATGVNNGVYTINAINLTTNSPYRNYTQDGDRNRLGQVYPTTNNVCTYTPKRDLYNFPLYVGKTWNSTWHYGCQVNGVPAYHEDASVVASVDGQESITTAAGTFDALRISYVISYTNSNDPAGFTTYSETLTTWWSTELGRVVKWRDTYGYPSWFSNLTYTNTFTQELISIN